MNTPDPKLEAPDTGVGCGDLFGVWIPITERLPAKGRRVIVICQNGIHPWRTVGQWWPAGTMDASDWEIPPEDWWDDAGETCTNPEDGFWEACVEAEGSWMLNGVTHWMPLPPLPNVPDEPQARSKTST